MFQLWNGLTRRQLYSLAPEDGEIHGLQRPSPPAWGGPCSRCAGAPCSWGLRCPVAAGGLPPHPCPLPSPPWSFPPLFVTCGGLLGRLSLLNVLLKAPCRRHAVTTIGRGSERFGSLCRDVGGFSGPGPRAGGEMGAWCGSGTSGRSVPLSELPQGGPPLWLHGPLLPPGGNHLPTRLPFPHFAARRAPARIHALPHNRSVSPAL